VYGGVLFRPQHGFYEDPQWRGPARWDEVLAPHYATAERMLGVQLTPFDSPALQLTKEVAQRFGVQDTFSRTPMGVFFGEPGKTVEDPYFGGERPARTGCTRCGDCLVGCRVGAANAVTKNYLWFAENVAPGSWPKLSGAPGRPRVVPSKVDAPRTCSAIGAPALRMVEPCSP
jgi:cholesterol oxidase